LVYLYSTIKNDARSHKHKYVQLLLKPNPTFDSSLESTETECNDHHLATF